MNFFGELLLNLRERTYFVVVKLFVILCFYDLFYGFFLMSSQFGLTSFCVGLHVCFFVCYFLRRRRGGSLELRGNGAHLKEIGTRVGTELQCIVVAVG